MICVIVGFDVLLGGLVVCVMVFSNLGWVFGCCFTSLDLAWLCFVRFRIGDCVFV